jgi:S-adenosylmethionine:tRNA-ribosyltransferase-isomerase (queuine synthetase)
MQMIQIYMTVFGSIKAPTAGFLFARNVTGR